MVSTVIVLSACHFTEFVTSVVFHELILCLGSFHLQGMFQALSLSLSPTLPPSLSLCLTLERQSFKSSMYMSLTHVLCLID